jgi:hypothetical protein
VTEIGDQIAHREVDHLLIDLTLRGAEQCNGAALGQDLIVLVPLDGRSPRSLAAAFGASCHRSV